jgi:Ni/Fe-hydrogenase subunit HybB-like protein
MAGSETGPQSCGSLGALFLIAPAKLHPLWYSPYLPVFFFVSAIIAGLSMVIFESTLSHHYFADKMDESHLKEKDTVALGFGKAASLLLAGYFITKVIGISEGNNWHLLGTKYGFWFLVELLSSERYFPHWMEIVISVFLVTVGIIAFRFIVTRMPILYSHPDYEEH